MAPAESTPTPSPASGRALSIEEQLCAAAHRILSDGRAVRHAPAAQAWAVTFLARSAPGQDLTTFIRAAMRQAPISPRQIQQLQREHVAGAGAHFLESIA